MRRTPVYVNPPDQLNAYTLAARCRVRTCPPVPWLMYPFRTRPDRGSRGGAASPGAEAALVALVRRGLDRDALVIATMIATILEETARSRMSVSSPGTRRPYRLRRRCDAVMDPAAA